jgi:hypothetical protein
MVNVLPCCFDLVKGWPMRTQALAASLYRLGCLRNSCGSRGAQDAIPYQCLEEIMRNIGA